MHFPMASRIPILGVPIDPVTMEEAVTCVLSMLHGLKQCHVMTPNNEMLVEADRNAAFKSVLQRSDLNLPDSTGLLWAARRTGERIPDCVGRWIRVFRCFFWGGGVEQRRKRRRNSECGIQNSELQEYLKDLRKIWMQIRSSRQ